jgi:hypothetical protein
MVDGFTTTCAVSAYHHWSCEFEPRSWWGVLDTTLCDKISLWLAAGRWFSSGTLVSISNKTDRHDITDILLEVALNTIKKPNHYVIIFFQGQKTDLYVDILLEEVVGEVRRTHFYTQA